MAVSVNTVYQTVLYILNKEQRGYVPPAEFNSIAEQVQLEIFNSYFPDANQVNRANQNNTQNDTEYFNVFENLSYRLTPFIQEITLLLNTTLIGASAIYSDGISFSYPLIDPVSSAFNPVIYLLGEVTCVYNGNPILKSVAQRVSKKEYTRIEKSKLTSPTSEHPIYYNYGYTDPTLETNNGYIVIPSPLPDSVTASAIMAPPSPTWGFIGGSNGQYLYNRNSSVDFSLDGSEQANLVTNILKYLGIVISDPTIIQVAAQEAQKVEINEKS